MNSADSRRQFVWSAVLACTAAVSSVAGAEPKNAGGKTTKGSTTVVVVEGAGLTSEDAIKDAFRSAVRQVVGAVVDAETVVKNDEIISEKILTYSDGIIKTYEEISKKQENGLFRVKIKATVEHRSVVEKLRAAKVAVKGIDGPGIHAEAVTGLEREKEAKELVKNRLKGYLSSIVQAEVEGTPKIIRKTSASVTLEIALAVTVTHDHYDKHIARLTDILDKSPLTQGKYSCFTQPNETAYERLGRLNFIQEGHFGKHESLRLSKTYAFVRALGSKQLPRDSELKDTEVILATNCSRAKADKGTAWKWYYVPQDWLFDVPFERLTCDHLALPLEITFLDKTSRIIAKDRFAFDSPINGILPALGVVRTGQARHVILSPYFVWSNLYYCNKVTFKHTITMPLNDVQKVHAVKCAPMPRVWE